MDTPVTVTSDKEEAKQENVQPVSTSLNVVYIRRILFDIVMIIGIGVSEFVAFYCTTSTYCRRN